MKGLGLKSRGARLTVAGVLLANTGFWCWLWVDITSRLEPYEHRPLRFEEVLPTYIFFGQALPFPQDYTAPSLRAMRVIHWPCDELSIWASWAAVRRFRLVEITLWRVETIGGVSVAGYQLISTMLLSYLQWLLIAFVMTSLWQRLGRSRTGPD